MRGDGDGWLLGPDGAKRWGRYGAAGLLLRAPGERGPVVLLQHRAPWSHHGDTWGLPGGARDSHETAMQTALREAEEEAGVHAGEVMLRAERLTSAVSHGWSYTTVIADAARQLVTRGNHESIELRWVAEQDLTALPLHPAFAASWPQLRTRPLRALREPQPCGSVAAEAETTTTDAVAGGGLPRTVELPNGEFAWVAPPWTAADSQAVPPSVGTVPLSTLLGWLR